MSHALLPSQEHYLGAASWREVGLDPHTGCQHCQRQCWAHCVLMCLPIKVVFLESWQYQMGMLLRCSLRHISHQWRNRWIPCFCDFPFRYIIFCMYDSLLYWFWILQTDLIISSKTFFLVEYLVEYLVLQIYSKEFCVETKRFVLPVFLEPLCICWNQGWEPQMRLEPWTYHEYRDHNRHFSYCAKYSPPVIHVYKARCWWFA